jgi:hypothetical protein
VSPVRAIPACKSLGFGSSERQGYPVIADGSVNLFAFERRWRTTSERISSACGNFADKTLTLAVDASQRAPDSNEPPRLSISSAIRVASRFNVPLVNKLAVMSARPANSFGSTSPPFLITTWAETSGVSGRSMTIMRSPFGNVCSKGGGRARSQMVWGADCEFEQPHQHLHPPSFREARGR